MGAQKGAASKGAPPSSADDDEAPTERDPKPQPTTAGQDANCLYIVVPKGDGTNDQKLCTGSYYQISSKANGFPIFEHERGDRWLYNSCEDDYWYVGDEEERDDDFKTC